MPLPSNWTESLQEPSFLIAVASVILHVCNYNLTARLEYNTRIFTKVFGKSAIYFYAVYLVLSAIARDYFIKLDMELDENSLTVAVPVDPKVLGSVLFASGVLLNLWTLFTLGVKGMYNGDSFGWLFDEPVTSGPFRFFSDPQYLGTAFSCLGAAVYNLSFRGLVLSAVMYTVFMISVDFLETPHMEYIYKNRKESELYSTSKPAKAVSAKSPAASKTKNNTSTKSSPSTPRKTPKKVKAEVSPNTSRSSPRVRRGKTD